MVVGQLGFALRRARSKRGAIFFGGFRPSKPSLRWGKSAGRRRVEALA